MVVLGFGSFVRFRRQGHWKIPQPTMQLINGIGLENRVLVRTKYNRSALDGSFTILVMAISLSQWGDLQPVVFG